MGNAYAVPQTGIEQMLAMLGKGSGKAKSWMNKNIGIPGVETGIGLGDMIMGQAPEMLNEMSWGKSPIIPSGNGGRIDPRMMDVASLAAPAGMFGKKFATEGLKDLFKVAAKDQAEGGYIGGFWSSKADITKLNHAERMKADGKSADEIFDKTKWWLDHPDGKARFEFAHGDEKYLSSNAIRNEMGRLEDSNPTNIEKARLKDMQYMLDGNPTLHSSRMKNSPFDDYYPDDADELGIKSVFGDDPNSFGAYHPKLKEITINNRPEGFDDKMLSTAQHETQHAISDIEGFAPGGNPKNNIRYLLSRTNEEKMKLLRKGAPHTLSDSDKLKYYELAKFQDMVVNANPKKQQQLYKQLADESQARLVQERAHLPQAEMDADPFFKKYDVPLNKMIIAPRR